MRIQVFLFVIALPLWLAGCEKTWTGPDSVATPSATFRRIWQDFDEHYGLFAVKQMDWDSLYTAVGAQVDDQMSEEQLYRATIALLAPLRDKHVTLYPASSPKLPRWSVDLNDDGVYVIEDFELDIVRDRYLTDRQDPAPFIQYGWIAPKVGYLHIQHMDGKRKIYEKALDAAFRFLGEADGLVLDIRDNSGGFDPVAQYVAGRFASARQRYMTVRKKNGPGPDDFTDSVEWYVQPEGDDQFTKPIVVLTSGATASAAETFLLALHTQNHVTQLGTTTSGNFSDAPMWEAPNGWTYTISVGDYRAADGKSYEGIGLKPRIEVRNEKTDLLAGKDRALERAVELLR